MERIGTYRVIRVLETAASSQILLAVSETFGVRRKVVLKRMLPSIHDDEATLRRLTREAMAYARLNHPSIVRMYDFFSFEDRPVIVLEYVDGLTVEQVLATYTARKERIARGASLHIGAGVFAGLAAAHAARDPQTNEFAPVIHRDVSPGNVLLTRDAEVKLADFSFAKVVGRSPRDTAKSRKGSVGYMAPEQVLLQEVTVRTDVYGGALLLRELLTGEPAFPMAGAASQGERILRMASPELVPIEQHCPDLPAEIVGAMATALRPNQDERAITAAEMHRVLRDAAARERGEEELKRVLEGFERPEPMASDSSTLRPPPDPEAIDIEWEAGEAPTRTR